VDHLPTGRYAPSQVIVPISHLNLPAAKALDYARSISDDVLAVHVAAETEGDPEEFKRRWKEWAGDGIPLMVLASPYREVVSPLVDLVEERARTADGPVTVVLPAVLPRHLWEEPLHNQLEYILTIALLGKPNVVITSVPTRLPD